MSSNEPKLALKNLNEFGPLSVRGRSLIRHLRPLSFNIY